VGEAAVDTRREVEETREELGGTIAELRNRGERARDTVKRRAPMVAGAVVVLAAGGAGTVLLVRSRRSRAESLLQRPVRKLRRQRAELVDAVAERVAEMQAQAERRANPLWRMAAAKGLETLATVGVAAVVRKAVAGRG
jgi:hypothetical protein